MVEEVNKNWDFILSRTRDDTKKYFLEYSINKQLDHSCLKSFLMFYCLKLDLPPVPDDDLDYILKFYSNGLLSLNEDQFEEVVETFNVIKFLDPESITNHLSTLKT